jgi:hypothetical protein
MLFSFLLLPLSYTQMGKYELRVAVKTLYRLRPKVTSSSISVASQGDLFKYISCVPRWPLQVYQLRPKVTSSTISVASQGDLFNSISCVPRLVRNCTSSIERDGCTKCPAIGRFLHNVIVLYFTHNYMHTYGIVEWYRQHSCYIMLLSNV